MIVSRKPHLYNAWASQYNAYLHPEQAGEPISLPPLPHSRRPVWTKCLKAPVCRALKSHWAGVKKLKKCKMAANRHLKFFPRRVRCFFSPAATYSAG